MATQGDETDEEYPDDPIKLIDFEQKRINILKKLRNNCQTEGLTDSDVDVESDSASLSKYKRVCLSLPASFFTISKNVELLNECRPVAVEVVDCIKHSSYNKKKIRSTNSESYIIIVDDDINEECVENVCESDIEDCVVISDSEKEESDISFGEQMGKPKIRPVDITSYVRSNKRNINNSVQRTSETLKPNEKVEKDKGVLQNKNRIDFKKNKGLVGLRIVQRANVDDRSKTLVGQKQVERVNVNKTKERSNVEIKKSNKVDGKTIQCSKPVHHDVNTLKVSSKSKLLDSNTTENSEKYPESNLITFNDKHSITNKESLRPNNTYSSKVYKETEKPSSVPEEINLTTKQDKQKSSTDTSEKQTKNVEPNKTKNNKEKECISKYFKDVWDKDLRLALEPDTIQLKKRNSLKYFKDKLKIDKRKSRKENKKRESNPAKIDTDNNEKANNHKSIEKLKKTTKDREKSKKKDSIVSDNTKKDSTHNKSMPSLLLGEQIATGKSQIEDNVSSKSTNKRTSEKLRKNKCMGVKEKSDVQPISNPKNRDVVLNEKSQTSCKDSSKLVTNQLATQNKLDKKAERNKNSPEKTNLGSSIVNYNLNRDVIDKDKPMSTFTGNNRINPSVIYKDKTSSSIPTALNKQLQADKPLTSKPTATQQTINQNNSHPNGSLSQKQNEDLYNEDRKKSECLAKYLFYLQSLNSKPIGEFSLKHAVKPQECILSYVNGNQQEPKEQKIHTVSIGDVQKSSNSTGNNTSSATRPMNSKQIPNEPGNGLVPPAKTMPNNSTNDCNKPDAVKKSDKTFDDNMTNSSIQDIPPNLNRVKEIDTATSIKTNDSTNECNKPNAVKKRDKTFDDNTTNSSMQDIPSNSNLVKEIDTATSIKNEVSIRQEDPSESSCLPPMNPAQQTASQGRIIEEYGETIKAFVINRNDYHKGKLGIAPQVNMKTNENPNTFPHGVIHCAPIYQGAPQNMPQGDQNQFGFYHPPQGKHILHAQPQMSQALPQMSQSSPKILQHSQQMLQPSQQISQLSSQISQPSRQIPDLSQQMPQPSQQMSQSLPKILQHSRQVSQSSPQISQPSQQMPQPLSQMSQPSRRMPQPSQQISQPSQQISQPSRQMPQPSRQMPQPSRQMLQPSQQMSQPSQQMSQPSQQMSQPSQQVPQPSRQMLQPSQQMSQPSHQMSQPSHQISQPSRQIPQPLRQMPQPSRQIPQPSQQVPQTSPEILQHLQQMSQPSRQMLQSSRQMLQLSQQMPQTSPEILQHLQQMSQPLRQMPQPSRQMPQPSHQMSQPSHQILQPSQQMPQHSQQMPQPSRQIPQPLRQMPQPSRQIPQPSQQVPQTSPEMLQHLQQMSQLSRQMPQPPQNMSRPPPQMSCPAPQMSLPQTQMWHSSPQFNYSAPQMSHNAQPPLWYPEMSPRSSQMYHPALQKSHLQLGMTPPRHHIMSNCGLRMLNSQTQNSDLCACEKCQIDFPQMSNLPPQMLHPPSGMLNRQQQMPHFLQCLSNAPPQISHPLPTSSHTHEQTWNPSQQLSNPQSQISHPPQQMSNTPPQMPYPTVKYDNVAQSVSGSTIIGRNNDGVVRKINIGAAHSKGLPSSTETKLNNEDDAPLESEQEMFEELCKITTLESPIKEDSKTKKDLKRQLSKDDKIDESTPNRRPRISPMLTKLDDALQGLKKRSEPVCQKGYSPPILPIATFEKTFEILAQANIELSDNRNYEPIKIKWNPILRKRRCLSVDERRDNAKKISIDEYKKRSTVKDDKAIDFVVQHRKDDQNGGQNPDQDLGYDSDTTMKQ